MITVEEEVKLVQEYSDLRKIKDSISDSLKDVNDKISTLEAKLVSLMQETKQKRLSIDGIGTLSIRETTSVVTPKELEEKRALWQYIVAKYGEDAAWNKFGVNSASLNSFFKAEKEAIDDAEERIFFRLPGVGEPQTFFGLSFTRSK